MSTQDVTTHLPLERPFPGVDPRPIFAASLLLFAAFVGFSVFETLSRTGADPMAITYIGP